MESSRDSGCRHDAGRLVQFCACRNPTITICRAMYLLLDRLPTNKLRLALFQIKLRGEAVFAGKRAQLVPGGVLDLDAGLGALLGAHMLDLAGIEHARAAGGGRRRLEITREVSDFLLELGERAKRRYVEHRHEAAVVVPPARLDPEAEAGE